MFIHHPSGRLLPGLAMLLAVLGLGLCPPAARGAEQEMLEQDLAVADQAIVETQAALDRALKGFDQQAVATAGRRLHDLKQRRERIARELSAVSARDQILENTVLARERDGLRRRFGDLEQQVREAAAAFDAEPTQAHAVRLRDLNLELIALKDELARAERAARTPGLTSPPGDSGAAAPPP